MKKNTAIIVAASLALSAAALAQLQAPAPILPNALKFSGLPAMPGAESAQIVGEPQKAGPYLMRVKLAAGAKIPPHTHPDERNSTVLSGTLYVGFGEKFDESELVAIPVGAVYVAPAGVPHYIWAKDGPAVYQEAGNGPTGTKFSQQ
jgi:quercetin dioxygenase-like cupin family protein